MCYGSFGISKKNIFVLILVILCCMSKIHFLLQPLEMACTVDSLHVTNNCAAGLVLGVLWK